jgi:hypothetical protein
MKTSTKRILALNDRIRRTRAELRNLAEKLEDLIDIRDFEKAVVRNAGKPLIPWEVVAKELDIKPPKKKRRCNAG